jgi:murein DD-endopeptidase MepM/ murein hydrolase activator NlpD
MMNHPHSSRSLRKLQRRSPQKKFGSQSLGQQLTTWVRRNLSTLKVAAIAIITGSLILSLHNPARALQANINPTTPQLGDTLYVSFRINSPAASAPTVSLRQKTYPAFEVAPQQFRALLPTTPLDAPGGLPIRISVGEETQTLNLQLKKRAFPIQRIWLPPGKDGNLSDYEFDQVDAFKKIVSPEKFWKGPFLRPNNGPITTGYGVRRYYNGVFAKDYYHRGIDYAGNAGSAVIAPAGGRVALVGREKEGFVIHGNCVGIDHGQGVESIFLHMSRINVQVGDRVQAGQTIGTLGNTGASTGPHLHWGLYVNGLSVDPVPWREKGFS